MAQSVPGTRALRTFAAAARHLSFTRAADEVGLTPAAVSYQIKELEDQLGVTLFTRSSRSIRLTPAGIELFEATAEALDILQRAVSRARKMNRVGELRVSTGPRFATNWLIPRLPKLKARHPHLELRLDISDEVRDFEADDVDAAIRFGAGRYDKIISQRLFATEVVPVCSPKLIASSKPLVEPRDLMNHALCYVDCRVDDIQWPNWRTWMTAAGIDDFDDSRCIAFSDSNHVVQAVLEGGVVGLVEAELIETHLADGRLVRVFDISIPAMEGYAYHLLYPREDAEDSRIVEFRDWLLEELKSPHPSLR